MRYRVLATLFVVTLLASLAVHGSDLPRGAIAGDVFYLQLPPLGAAAAAPRHIAVRGARISLDQSATSLLSDKRGHFQVANVPAGPHLLSISHPSFRDPLELHVTVPPGGTVAASAQMGETYYLAIGIAHYHSQDLERLDAPPRDAHRMMRQLANAFPGDVTLLINDAATKTHIQAAIARIAAAIRPQDYFVFYFSGHESSEDVPDHPHANSNFLMAVDSVAENTDHDIYDTDMARWLSAFPAPNHIALILDSCYSGGFFRGQPVAGTRWKRLDAGQQDAPFAPYTVLASSSADEASIDTDSGSLYTNELLRVLSTTRKHADRTPSHRISAAELFQDAAPRTITSARNCGETQHPQMLLAADMPLYQY